MFDIIRTLWKYSKLRFYVKNAIWNYQFWFFCQKKYNNISYFKRNFFNVNKQKVHKRRFEGYVYKNRVFLDNPGFSDIERDVWEVWKKKNLL